MGLYGKCIVHPFYALVLDWGFNSILNLQERIGRAEIRPHHFIDFYDCIAMIGLMDIIYSRNFLTWNNRQERRISCILDKVLVNYEWC